MSERRPLTAGVRPVDLSLEKQFVFGDRAPAATEPPVERVVIGRSPLTTRVRADYAAALKRASLERQLAGQTPHTVQDILEEALGPWLAGHGYLP